ncbi:MAG: 50S ribosomal protein L1 [Candidatus Omnitrophica bacterium]|nr:50S ribosomal protein L1 [Candidatus Omnitrophota bacterium]
MMSRGKRYQEAEKKLDRDKFYSVEEAVGILKELAPTKFNQSVDVSISLGVDPKRSDQMVRGSSKLPYGTGKTKKVLVFCEPEKEEEARTAGADFVGSQDLLDKISKGWLGFDYCISTPSMMRNIARLGKILGPRGLMPSPKSGSVTDNLSVAVKDAKEGKLDFKMDKFGCLNVAVGKISFSREQISKNIETFFASLLQLRPQSLKGRFVKSITISTTMSPGCKINLPKEFQL